MSRGVTITNDSGDALIRIPREHIYAFRVLISAGPAQQTIQQKARREALVKGLARIEQGRD